MGFRVVVGFMGTLFGRGYRELRLLSTFINVLIIKLQNYSNFVHLFF